jgi:aldehyde:ferredoxin oxidoreductase
MSLGVTLAWATEALARGLISEQETGGPALAWGDYGAYVEATRRIVGQPNEFYRALAHGAEHAAERYGGMDFALTFGRNEMAGYHTGPACHTGYLTGARHSHLDNAGYGIDQKAGATGKSLTPEGVGAALVEEERWRQVLTSLVVCLFARGIYTPATVLDTLATAGFAWSAEDLARLGADALRRKQAFKRAAGFELEQVRIPRRILETATPMGQVDEGFVRQAIEAYARLV